MLLRVTGSFKSLKMVIKHRTHEKDWPNVSRRVFTREELFSPPPPPSPSPLRPNEQLGTEGLGGTDEFQEKMDFTQHANPK